MTEALVLIVDDDPALLEALPQALRLRLADVRVETADSARAALERIAASDYDAIVTDIKMPGMDGLALLDEIRGLQPETPTLLITGHGEHDLAVQALRRGAYDFIQKPIDRDYFVASLKRAIEKRRLGRTLTERDLALELHARVLDKVGDGVFLVDADGVVRLWNHGAAAITGLAPQDALGRPPAEVLRGWEGVAPTIPSGDVGGKPLTTIAPLDVGGRELWLSMCAVAFPEGTVYSFQDVTGERSIERLRDEFVATASHELRTPLAAIYGSAQTLRQKGAQLDPETYAALMDVIVAESERLARVVNDILLASHLDSGRLHVVTEQVDAVELAAGVVDAMRAQAADGVSVSLVAAGELPPVPADPDRLRRVLVNLMENAIKYSPDGGAVELAVEARNGRLRFSVRDEGLGVPPHEQERIFDKFYRADPNLTRGVGGTGLGLYICRELVDRMSGRIWVESEQGKGSVFRVELPLPQTGGEMAAAAEPAAGTAVRS